MVVIVISELPISASWMTIIDVFGRLYIIGSGQKILRNSALQEPLGPKIET